MSVFGLNSYPGNSTSGDSIVVTVKKKIVLAECGCLSVKVQPTVVAWHGWCGSDVQDVLQFIDWPVCKAINVS
ncbi:hypothetical protein T11_10256 [Trichinella zimbabwensis]|uniref:Uncharacterized protein n=1 Tax=Trichinella zimbabwensis TaxID=268475 RepID=A0A0V1HIG4_9BILA|nr:hypothetical protein T11_10256 [Trichinella zimbabwensis]